MTRAGQTDRTVVGPSQLKGGNRPEWRSNPPGAQTPAVSLCLRSTQSVNLIISQSVLKVQAEHVRTHLPGIPDTMALRVASLSPSGSHHGEYAKVAEGVQTGYCDWLPSNRYHALAAVRVLGNDPAVEQPKCVVPDAFVFADASDGSEAPVFDCQNAASWAWAAVCPPCRAELHGDRGHTIDRLGRLLLGFLLVVFLLVTEQQFPLDRDQRSVSAPCMKPWSETLPFVERSAEAESRGSALSSSAAARHGRFAELVVSHPNRSWSVARKPEPAMNQVFGGG